MTTSHVPDEREPRGSGWEAYCAAARAILARGEANPASQAKEGAREE